MSQIDLDLIVHIFFLLIKKHIIIFVAKILETWMRKHSLILILDVQHLFKHFLLSHY